MKKLSLIVWACVAAASAVTVVVVVGASLYGSGYFSTRAKFDRRRDKLPEGWRVFDRTDTSVAAEYRNGRDTFEVFVIDRRPKGHIIATVDHSVGEPRVRERVGDYLLDNGKIVGYTKTKDYDRARLAEQLAATAISLLE